MTLTLLSQPPSPHLQKLSLLVCTLLGLAWCRAHIRCSGDAEWVHRGELPWSAAGTHVNSQGLLTEVKFKLAGRCRLYHGTSSWHPGRLPTYKPLSAFKSLMSPLPGPGSGPPPPAAFLPAVPARVTPSPGWCPPVVPSSEFGTCTETGITQLSSEAHTVLFVTCPCSGSVDTTQRRAAGPWAPESVTRKGP